MSSVLLTILISAVTAAVFSAAVILLMRQRLGGQFAEIFHRFSQVRDSLRSTDAAIRSFGATREAGVTQGSRLDQLGLAFARFQQDTARRLGPLIPLADERERGGTGRELTERLLRQLERHWAPAFGVTVDEDDLWWLFQSLKRTEALWLDDVPAPLVDTLGRTIAVMSLPRRPLRIVDVGTPGGLFSLFVQRALSRIFERVEVIHLGESEPESATPVRAGAAARFTHAARMVGASPFGAVYGESLPDILPNGERCDALILDAARLEKFGSETVLSLLAAVAPDGLVILAGENSDPANESLSSIAAKMDGFQTLTAAWKTLVLRRVA